MKRILLLAPLLLASCGAPQIGGSSFSGQGSGPVPIEGNQVQFGSYPQTEVHDASLIEALNGIAKTPNENDGWNSFEFYSSGEATLQSDYIDLVHNGSKYRGIYFEQYRPYLTTIASPTSEADLTNSFQYRNGYRVQTHYWFAYEPIVWDILDETDGMYFLTSDLLLDSQCFQAIAGESVIGETTIYPNNYKESSIREFLNEDFYEAAFSAKEMQCIPFTHVDNSASTTDDANNPYACEDTTDRIFLLSYENVTDPLLGFNSDRESSDPARICFPTDYAKALGCKNYQDYDGAGEWWARSPTQQDGNFARAEDYEGYADVSYVVRWTAAGVRPALNVRK